METTPPNPHAVMPQHGRQNPLLHETLTPREWQVFMLLARGTRIKDIATALKISPKTASTYKVRLMAKMGFANIVELITHALSRGLSS